MFVIDDANTSCDQMALPFHRCLQRRGRSGWYGRDTVLEWLQERRRTSSSLDAGPQREQPLVSCRGPISARE
ncbi:MAG: hypothetical protein IPL01_11450 [Acidobacteria bacterium]|nr:hypothetical protein [Acidobacteriota bacterium]